MTDYNLRCVDCQHTETLTDEAASQKTAMNGEPQNARSLAHRRASRTASKCSKCDSTHLAVSEA